MKKFEQLDVYDEEYEILLMPNVRVIGKAYRCTFNPNETPWQKFWDEYNAAQDIISSLPTLLKNGMICWIGDCPVGSDYYTYMPAVICPADTPVPKGLDYRDLPASYVAKGKYVDNLDDVVQKLKQQGFKRRYTDIGTDLGWDAELYTIERANQSSSSNEGIRWLVPCIKVEE